MVLRGLGQACWKGGPGGSVGLTVRGKALGHTGCPHMATFRLGGWVTAAEGSDAPVF